MDNTVDLRSLFEGWPYDPDSSARIIRGTDGREILQVRQPLGIEQYELVGRPDGQRPHDMESLFDYHLDRLAKCRAEGKADDFKLNHRDCTTLFDEGVLYYYRYLNLFQLKEWDRVLKDTDRNIRLFDFVREHAKREEDRQHLEQWRPYILRMHAVAQAMLAVDADRYEDALHIVRETIDKIEALDEMENPTFEFECERSISALKELADHLEQTRPISPLERLERDLERAVAEQEFERAAELRDRIKALENGRG